MGFFRKFAERAIIEYVTINLKLKNSILDIIRWLLFKQNIRSVKIKKIIIFRTGAIGDSICAMPAIYSISKHFNNATIDILTNTGGKDKFGLDKLLDKKLVNYVIDYDTKEYAKLLPALKAEKYDLIIELPQAGAVFRKLIRNIVYFRMVGIRSGFGWEVSKFNNFKRTQEAHRHFISETERLLNIVYRNGVAHLKEIIYPYNITDEDKQVVENFFFKQNPDPLKKVIGIVVGAKRNTNRWPLAYFREIIHYLSQKGFYCIAIGGPEDKTLVRQLGNIDNLIDCTGMFSPIQSGLALTKCEFVISNDTGPMHLAYTMGVKVIALFSSRDYPGLWFPPTDKNIVLRSSNIKCSICLLESCSDNICMQAIKPAAVIDAVEKLLER